MLSLIIPSYDKPELTAFHVRESLKSTVPPDEVIVVNDHGNPEMREMLPKGTIYAYINEDIPWNYTGARNLGVWLSRGDILVFEDTDNIPSRKVYEKGLELMKEHPEYGRVTSGWRPKVYFEEIKGKEQEDWFIRPKFKRLPHDDTSFMQRWAYLKIKGCDERFAGKYGWSSTDWKRRIGRAGIPIGSITVHYFSILDGNTNACDCGDKRVTTEEKVWCTNCNRIIRRRSGINYHMARESDGHYQSPQGILGFTFTYERL